MAETKYDEAQLASIRTRAYVFLSPHRRAHVAGCEKAAVFLAERYGADVQKAAVAAILHDITKNLELKDQLILCERYGIICDDIELKNASLLHAKTGACKAREEFCVDEEIFGAIWWHTTGRPCMNLLEKILYLADYIEPTRNFDGINLLREAAGQDLNKAICLGLKMSIEDVQRRCAVVHPVSIEAYDYYKEQNHG